MHNFITLNYEYVCKSVDVIASPAKQSRLINFDIKTLLIPGFPPARE